MPLSRLKTGESERTLVGKAVHSGPGKQPQGTEPPEPSAEAPR